MSSDGKKTDMEEGGKPALVPKLRFPEFRETGGWDSDSMGDIYSFKGNNSLSRDKLNYLVGSVKNIHYGDIHTKFATHFDITNEPVPFINETDLGIARGENFCLEGDMIFADASEDLDDIGKSIELIKLNGERLVAGLHTILARQTGDRIVKGFGGHLFKSAWVRSQIQREAQGAKVLGISANRLRNLLLPLPCTKDEQQKIADCLTSLDELITAQARKVDALKKHKKGLMQDLFPREGKTQPRRRFPGFQNDGAWRPNRLQEVTYSVFDGTHQTPTYTPDGVPFYSVENLISGHANKFISRSDYLLTTKKNKPQKGDVLVTRIGKIGYSQVVTWDHDFSVYVTLAVIKQSKSFNSHYLNYFIQSDFYQSELRRNSLPNAVPPKINLDNLRATTVLLPDEKEQEKIAACLTCLDTLITAETQKHEALNRHKRGLMQQLFPSPVES
jgi:type I restriction enzyme S subunit